MPVNEQPQQPLPKRKSYENVSVRTGADGGGIVIRPNQFIANATDEDRLRSALAIVLGEISGNADTAAADAERIFAEPLGEPFRGGRQLFGLPADREPPRYDVIRVVRGLRDLGVSAQPNHVYTVSSLGTAGTNIAAPNMLTPNMLTPNMLTPNMLTPNMLTGVAGFGATCCCPGGLDHGTANLTVPKLAARPIDGPPNGEPAQETSLETPDHIEIHIIDVLSTIAFDDTDSLTGEYTSASGLTGADAVDENNDGWIDPVTGHGDFIKSIIQRHSGLKATLWQAADPLGIIDDTDLVTALEKVVDTSKPNENPLVHRVLNLSLAGYNMDDRPGDLLADQIEAMIADGWIIVAAAGNNASCRLAWPAALPGVIAVGALGKHAPAWFSNFGAWVDVSAPGVDIPSRLRMPAVAETGTTDRIVRIEHDEQSAACRVVRQSAFGEWATWSGTSFAAPLVAAKIAQSLDSSASAPTNPRELRDANETAIDAVFRNDTVDWLPYYGRLIS